MDFYLMPIIHIFVFTIKMFEWVIFEKKNRLKGFGDNYDLIAFLLCLKNMVKTCTLFVERQ